MDDVASDLRKIGVKKKENKSLGQNRVGINHEGSQGHT
jgi:hypothetical protein